MQRGRWLHWVVGILVGASGCLLGPEEEELDGGGDEAAGDDGGAGGGDVPAIAYCDPVDAWPNASTGFEDRVLELVNQVRASGGSCGGQTFGAAGALTMNGALRCAARVHSLDMATRGFFDHVNPDGESPFVRFEHVGYDYSFAGENIAANQPTPEVVVQSWLDSPGHCANILEPDFVHLGVGYVSSTTAPYEHYWTQAFGRPF